MKTYNLTTDFAGCRGQHSPVNLSARSTASSKSLLEPTPAEEIAWQLLKPFINPIDCNIRWQFQNLDGSTESGIRAMNLSVNLNALFNGNPVQLAYLSKKLFIKHCRGIERLYYRSKWNGFASTGYGSYEQAFQKLNLGSLAKQYDLNHRKVISDTIALVLLGFDIDAHHGERDVEKTVALILRYFPGAYVEPSTNGLGRHIYVKLCYQTNHVNGSHYATLNFLASLTEEIGYALDNERKSKGYDAILDRIRGLPTQIGFQRDENGKVVMKTLPDSTQKPVLRIVQRPLVLKMPFYKGCDLNALDAFYQSPFYTLDYLHHVRIELLCKGHIHYEYDNSFEESMNEVLSVPLEAQEDCVDKTQPTNKPNSVDPPSAWGRLYDYETEVRSLVALQDSHERRYEFGMFYARELGRAPVEHELEREYRRVGLFKADSESDQKNKFGWIARWLERSFDKSKAKFNYKGYSQHREVTEAMVARLLNGRTFTWNKGEGDRVIRLDKLAALYWAMRHSQGRYGSTHFSRKQAKTALRQVLGVGVHLREVTAMFTTLEALGLIKKLNGYCPGKFGRGWKVLGE